MNRLQAAFGALVLDQAAHSVEEYVGRLWEAILPSELFRLLGARRAGRLQRIMRQSGLPPEPLLDLALEMLELASRKLAPAPITRTAVGLAAARWRNVSPEERSETLRKAAQARWSKPSRPRSSKSRPGND
jgi:hypothetical protein